MVAVSAISSSITRLEFLEVVGRVQHESPARLDRAAEVDRQVPGRFGLLDPDLLEQALEGQAVDQPVDHQPHGTFGGMGAEVDHAAGETRVRHLRHRDQQLAGERAFLGDRDWAMGHAQHLTPPPLASKGSRRRTRTGALKNSWP